MAGPLYEVTPLTEHFGAVIRDFSLHGEEPLPDEVVRQIKDDIARHRVLLFKGQGKIPGTRQVQISQQFGVVESTFYKHPRSPHPDIFRVSNDSTQGCTNVGTGGWHLDGTFMQRPFKYQMMHFHSVCEGGDTWFVPLKEFYEMQDEETKGRWDRLWFMPGSDTYNHPLVCRHPIRGDTTMVFHCGQSFCYAVGFDGDGTNSVEMRLDKYLPPDVLQDELSGKLNVAVDEIGYKMRWEVGDFLFCDNIGSVHYATPGTQSDSKEMGLRILHRTTIAGEDIPTKVDGRSSFVLE